MVVFICRGEMKLPDHPNRILSESVIWAAIEFCFHEKKKAALWNYLLCFYWKSQWMVSILYLQKLRWITKYPEEPWFDFSSSYLPLDQLSLHKSLHNSDATTEGTLKPGQKLAIVTADGHNKKYRCEKYPVCACVISLSTIFIKIFCHCSVLLVS